MYYISIDQGTTGSTVMIVDRKDFKIVAKENTEFKQILPSPGIVEHNLNDIWDSINNSMRACFLKNNIQPTDILGIGITNQRETVCAFDKDCRPIENAIVWQDRRTSDYCESLKSRGLESKIKETTGLTIDPYFSASKINWLIQNSEKVKKGIAKNNCLFGNIDTYILMKLTGGKSFFTEPTNASRTMLMDLKNLNWSDELCDIFNVPKHTLPEIKDSFCQFGITLGHEILPDGIPITGILGDQQAALFGQGGINSGDLKCTYGTGAFALLNTGSEIKYSKNGLLTTVAYSKNGKPQYAIEGSSYIAGAAIQWLRDNLNIISSAKESESLSGDISDLNEMKNICFYPYFTGIGSPFWKPNALASIQGISRDTNSKHITRACLESIALTIDDLLKAMEKDADEEIKTLRVDGGAVTNKLLNQMQSNFSKLIVQKPEVIETTAFGAALACALGLEKINLEDVKSFSKVEKEYFADDTNYYQEKKKKWKELQKFYL